MLINWGLDKMKITKKIVIIAVAVLVLLIGGGVAYATNTPTARADRQLNLGNKYLQEGKYQEAILAFQKVIQIEPKNISARLGLGQVYVSTKEYTKAEKVLKEVIQIDANNISAREDLFKIYLKVNDVVTANSVLQEMIIINPKKDVKQISSDLDAAKAINASHASYDQGIKQMNDKQYLEAMDSFQKVNKEDTERNADAQTKTSNCKKAFVDATLQKAEDAASNKDYQTALDFLDQVLKVDPNNQDALMLKSNYLSASQDMSKQNVSSSEEGNTPNNRPSNSQTLQQITDIALNEAKKLGTNPKINNIEAYDINGDGVSLNYFNGYSPYGKLIEINDNDGIYKTSNITEQYDSNNVSGGNFVIKKFSSNKNPQIISWWSGGSGGFLSLIAQINNNNSYETIWEKDGIYQGSVQVGNDKLDFYSNGKYVFSYPNF